MCLNIRINPSLAVGAITLLTSRYCYQAFAVTGRTDTAISSESAAGTFGLAANIYGGFVVKNSRFSGCMNFSFIPSWHLTSPTVEILAIKTR